MLSHTYLCDNLIDFDEVVTSFSEPEEVVTSFSEPEEVVTPFSEPNLTINKRFKCCRIYHYATTSGLSHISG